MPLIFFTMIEFEEKRQPVSELRPRVKILEAVVQLLPGERRKYSHMPAYTHSVFPEPASQLTLLPIQRHKRRHHRMPSTRCPPSIRVRMRAVRRPEVRKGQISSARGKRVDPALATWASCWTEIFPVSEYCVAVSIGFTNLLLSPLYTYLKLGL